MSLLFGSRGHGKRRASRGKGGVFCLNLRWAKSRDSYCRVASESYRCDLNHLRSLAVIFHPKNTDLDPRRPCVRCTAIRIARLVFVAVVFVPCGTAEWPARVDCLR